MSAIKPFDPSVPKKEVDRLFQKLRDTLIPKEIVPGANDDYGPSMKWIRKHYNAWFHDFSWETAEATIKKWPHFTTVLEDLTVHFIHQKSTRDRASIPLLLIHGWPGTWFEFARIIDPLTKPRSQDGDNTPSFHVVIPSAPGFCWSDGPKRQKWTQKDNARIYDQLMKRLGYDTYAVHGTDYGGFAARELAAKYTSACKAMHTTFCPSEPPPGKALTERERWANERIDWFNRSHLGYAQEMRTRPQTIGVAISDNPIGLLMWIGEKFNEECDPNLQGTPEHINAILVICSLFFLTQSAMTSMLCYYNDVPAEDWRAYNLRGENFVACPFAYSSFKYDDEPQSERAAARTGNLVLYKERDRGGHFPALEVPDDIVADFREFFSKWFKSSN